MGEMVHFEELQLIKAKGASQAPWSVLVLGQTTWLSSRISITGRGYRWYFAMAAARSAFISCQSDSRCDCLYWSLVPLQSAFLWASFQWMGGCFPDHQFYTSGQHGIRHLELSGRLFPSFLQKYYLNRFGDLQSDLVLGWVWKCKCVPKLKVFDWLLRRSSTLLRWWTRDIVENPVLLVVYCSGRHWSSFFRLPFQHGLLA